MVSSDDLQLLFECVPLTVSVTQEIRGCPQNTKHVLLDTHAQYTLFLKAVQTHGPHCLKYYSSWINEHNF